MYIENLLGIEDADELAREEERISKKKACELLESGQLDHAEPGTYPTLSATHGYLFDEIYEFAGIIRTTSNPANDYPYTPVMFLGSALTHISIMPQSTFDQIMDKYVEMNLAHPFYTGNGRAMRMWLDALLKFELGKVVDWRKVDRDAYCQALEKSPEQSADLRALLGAALVDASDEREFLFENVDASFALDGFSAFKASEL